MALQPTADLATADPGRGGRALGQRWLGWAALALSVVFIGYVAVQLADKGYTAAVIVAAFLALVVLALYGTRRAVPLKYLLPGLLLLLGLQVWPIVYTVATSLTNYGQGHLVTKEAATAQDIAYSVRQVPGSPTYQLSVAVKAGSPITTAPLAFLLVGQGGSLYVGDSSGLNPLAASDATVTSGRITAAQGYTLLNLKDANQRKDLSSFAVPTAGGGGIKASGFNTAYEGKAQLSYDRATDTVTDSSTGTVYVSKGARWVPKNGQGEALPVGWKENVGTRNFTDIFTNDTIRSGFLGIFVWNIAFATLSVLSTFVLGMLLALLLNNRTIRGRGVYRSLLILPYAVPAFVSALVWLSMFNQQFGVINQVTGLGVDWLGSPWAARAAILITNLWLGFPYMFIVCTGALQGLPSDVLEAARIDGAGAFRTLRSVQLPLLLVAVGPLLVASFAFNFNNFGLIFLMTKGGPFLTPDAQIGSTDLLITYAYRLAINGTAPNYGLASAVSVIIFVIVGLMSFPGFMRSKALEEVS